MKASLVSLEECTRTSMYIKTLFPYLKDNMLVPLATTETSITTTKCQIPNSLPAKDIFILCSHRKRKGENTFQGDAWIADSSFAVQKIELAGIARIEYQLH